MIPTARPAWVRCGSLCYRDLVAALTRMTYAEYLEAEAASLTRHEYVAGVVRERPCGPPQHGALVASITGAIGSALHGRQCRGFSSTARVRIEATDLTTYPDLSVVCGALAVSDIDRDAITNPILLVEVLDDSTEAYDRGEKFEHYRHLPSLREYLLVSQRRPKLESWRRNEQGIWMLSEAGAGETLTLAALEGVRLDVDLIYRDPLPPS